MPHQLTTFNWSTTFFTGTTQLDNGPFHIGTVGKLFKAQVTGQINYEGTTLGLASVLANVPAFGLQVIPHGSGPMDVVTSADNDSWLTRRQTGYNDLAMAWTAPSDPFGAMITNELRDDWAGQLAIGADSDCYLSIKTSTGGNINNMNTIGSIRLWWI